MGQFYFDLYFNQLAGKTPSLLATWVRVSDQVLGWTKYDNCHQWLERYYSTDNGLIIGREQIKREFSEKKVRKKTKNKINNQSL